LDERAEFSNQDTMAAVGNESDWRGLARTSLFGNIRPRQKKDRLPARA
jgi:hypothetical protein